jgi:hypothetical protein
MVDVPVAKQGGIFKRLETDAEYHARLRAAGKAIDPGWGGTTLDLHGDLVGMQRRIVESTT